MKTYKQEFIKFCIDNKVLTFGEFTLKSKRISPYFFNAGLFNTGKALQELGYYYAQSLQDSGLEYDVLFGPAYKGIPLVSSLVCALYKEFQVDVPYSFNRKEAKDHGEGGNIVGSKLNGRVVVVDDVITAGTAIRESIQLIKSNNATLNGVVVALDRQEKGLDTDKSAIQQIQQEQGIPVVCIVTLTEIIEYLIEIGYEQDTISKIKEYRRQYGVDV
jgi:orotate phosphoribosyltransferase